MSVAATISLDFVWSPGWRLMHISLMVPPTMLWHCTLCSKKVDHQTHGGNFVKS